MKSFEKVLEEFGAKNKELLEKRETIQKQIDEWHLSRKDEDHDHEEYVNFLKEIGYLLDEGEDFQITTQNVDDEIKKVAELNL